jgi:hypothetical protein
MYTARRVRSGLAVPRGRALRGGGPVKMPRCSDHVDASIIPSRDLHVRDIFRRHAGLWPDQ